MCFNASRYKSVTKQHRHRLDSRCCSIHGKFYEEMGYRRMSFPGPCIRNVAVLPEKQVDEVRERAKKLIPEEMSPELKKIVAHIWAQAEEIEPWFKVK